MSTPTTIQSNLIPMAVSADDITYKNIVCKKSWNFNGDTTVNQDETDCGPHVGLGANKWTVDFTALLNTSPNGATEVSASVMLGYWSAQTLIYVKLQYPTSGSPGTAFYIQGPAYITSFKLVNQVGSLMEFDGTLTGNAAVDITP